MGGRWKGVGGVHVHRPMLAGGKIASPKPAFRAWRCVTVERNMGMRNGGRERPTRFKEVRCWGGSRNVSPKQQGAKPGCEL
jgi:hypothetical protein